ncbi:MAG: small basic protein [Pirellulales bacterium]|jgi:small basic protein (TIGR04137 family)
MTMDKSLRTRKGSSSVRGVLTRAERITKLKEQERWQEGRSPIGLPKVRVQKLAMKKKKVKEDPAAADAKPAKK